MKTRKVASGVGNAGKTYCQHYAEYHGINLIIGSHTKTEILGVRNFVNKLIMHFDELQVYEIDEPNY